LRGSLYAEERVKHFFGAIFRLQHGKFVFKMGCSMSYLGFR
jgi:hypothetical protein